MKHELDALIAAHSAELQSQEQVVHRVGSAFARLSEAHERFKYDIASALGVMGATPAPPPSYGTTSTPPHYATGGHYPDVYGQHTDPYYPDERPPETVEQAMRRLNQDLQRPH